MYRFFEPELTPDRSKIVLSSENVRVARSVLRLRSGERVSVLNGRGIIATGRISGKRFSELDVEEWNRNPEPIPRVFLLQAMPKGTKSKWIVQKGVELGVEKISFFSSERSIAKSKVANERQWRQVAIEAIRQSGNPYLPVIESKETLQEILSQCQASLLVLLDNQTRSTSFREIMSTSIPDSIAVAIGPEGGWSPEERNLLDRAGFRPLRLGSYTMRTETASVAVLGAIRAHFN